ncbi:cyclophilin peptidyl-prolyl cis-trans isomerase Cyp8 [Microbotryomycetes sp. JL221]|nr:cyclophilin peptidyl-prolyl cis-trans isomerase Cyp8 [Microbotryomycetes sp. JL221]
MGHGSDKLYITHLNFARNNEGAYHDPVTFKTFNEHTHIVAIKTSGNVFARETVDRLNIKAGFWRDLVSDEPFNRSDIITLQDPLNVQNRDLSKFDYVRKDIKFDVEATEVVTVSKRSKHNKTDKVHALPTAQSSTKASATLNSAGNASTAPYNLSVVSTGRTGASLTSTSAPISTKIEHALWHEEDLMFEAVAARNEKGYLAQQGKYSDTVFHRLIPGFMVQGGDPTGTGRGGTSFWGKPFEDEHHYRTAQRGTVSMANSGPNTNGSQFFLTFRATPHLDGKHTVFGRLVGGDDVLTKIERVPSDPATDRPLKAITIRDAAVFGDPFEAYKTKLRRRLVREAEDKAKTERKQQDSDTKGRDRTTWFGTSLNSKRDNDDPALSLGNPTVGKYVSDGRKSSKRSLPTDLDEQTGTSLPKRAAPVKQAFGDFSAW